MCDSVQKKLGHTKVHIVSYNLDQKNVSKSKIHILPNYEQTNLKTAIVILQARFCTVLSKIGPIFSRKDS